MNHINVVVNRIDLLIFQCRMLWVHPANRLSFWLVFAFCALISFKNVHSISDVKGIIIALLVALIIAIGAMLIGFSIIVLYVLSASRSLRGVLGEREFTVTDSGLRESTKGYELLLKWGGSARLLRTRRLIHVQVTTGFYFLIPRRYFQDAAAEEQFWNAIQPLAAKTEK